MRNLIITLCVACAHFVSSLPQYSVEAQIVGSQQQYVQPPAQAFTDSPDANIIAFSPERTRARLSGGGSPRSQSRYPAAPQPLPVGPTAPEQYYVPQAAQAPQAVPQQAVQQQYVDPQVSSQPQLRSRQQFTTPPPAAEEASPHAHSTIPPIQILKLDKSQSLDGSYKQSWESANNIMVEETGYWKDFGDKNEKSLVQQGSYSYMSPDGTLISTSYTADEGGFKVEGSHLPTPPPIPEEIQKGLNQIYEGIRQQEELDAKDLKEGKIRPKQYDDLTGLPIDESSQNYPQNYPQNPPQRVAPRQRQQQPPQYQPAVQQPVQQYQPPQYQQPQYQQNEDQSQFYQRQQYRPTK